MGLGDGIGQNKPCHHLGPFKIIFPTGKFFGYLKEFLRNKLICTKKVTKLPSLTVQVQNNAFFKTQNDPFNADNGKQRQILPSISLKKLLKAKLSIQWFYR
jgi:hypothetical protein